MTCVLSGERRGIEIPSPPRAFSRLKVWLVSGLGSWPGLRLVLCSHELPRGRGLSGRQVSAALLSSGRRWVRGTGAGPEHQRKAYSEEGTACLRLHA